MEQGFSPSARSLLSRDEIRASQSFGRFGGRVPILSDRHSRLYKWAVSRARNRASVLLLLHADARLASAVRDMRLEATLKQAGHDVDTVPVEGIAGKDEAIVWRAAQSDRRFLVTQDVDFPDARKYAPGTHHGLLLVRLRQPDRGGVTPRSVAGSANRNAPTRRRSCFLIGRRDDAIVDCRCPKSLGSMASSSACSIANMACRTSMPYTAATRCL